MQKIVTAEEMHVIDRLTTEKYGISQLLLMENAAHAASRVIVEKLGGSVQEKSVLILCGKGNNGGDGAALGRILWQQGADVEVCLFGVVEDTKDEACTNFDILKRITEDEGFELSQSDLAFEEITGLEEWLDYDSLNFHSDDPDVIVDALFGTGLTRPLDGVFEQVAAFIDAFGENGDGFGSAGCVAGYAVRVECRHRGADRLQSAGTRDDHIHCSETGERPAARVLLQRRASRCQHRFAL
jgi:NAD(P)H-hydrate epimerase